MQESSDNESKQKRRHYVHSYLKFYILHFTVSSQAQCAN